MSMRDVPGGDPPLPMLIAAFAALYVIWGSTYLAILIAIETVPPFFMASARFLVAGSLAYGWGRLRGAARPSRSDWATAAIIGTFLLAGGNGAVVWAEQRVTSSAAALLVATMPFWMVLLEWARPSGIRPTGRVVLGLAIGFGGLGLLVGPGNVPGDGGIDLLGTAVLLAGTFCWATGSIYARGTRPPTSPVLSIGMQMLAGGAVLGGASLLAGEPAHLDPSAFSARSLLAVLYLIVFGSLIAFSAFVWLLRVSTPARVSTYAYVNPVVAVLLGWAFAGEPLTLRTVLAAAIIIGAVAVITTSRTAGPVSKPRGPLSEPRGPLPEPRGPLPEPRGPLPAPRAPRSTSRGQQSPPRGADHLPNATPNPANTDLPGPGSKYLAPAALTTTEEL